MVRDQSYLLKLTADEKRQLDQAAAARGVSRAAVIRAGLALLSGRWPRPATDALATSSTGSTGSPATVRPA